MNGNSSMETNFLEWLENEILTAILAKPFNKYDWLEKSELQATENPILRLLLHSCCQLTFCFDKTWWAINCMPNPVS